MQNAVACISKTVRMRRAVLVLSGIAWCCAAAAQDSSSPTVAQGKQVYKSARCYACHGEYGYGGAGPRFRQDHFLSLTDYVVGQILVGRGIMPSFANTLDNAQIAKVASYIRSSWGNDFGDVKPDEVVQVRKDLEKKAPPGPHASATEQPPGAPAPPAGGQSPGQALPPANMR
jgi:mono/diheme cytochrome c family protein